MTEVREALERLGLGEYADAFIEEGFDTWAIVAEITESDLTDLGVKLGHRRKLQRAIADYRQRSVESSPHPGDRLDVGGSTRESSSALRDRPREGPTKRKYKRHPKPDLNAPERPASAYVLFSNDMRELLKDRELSFTEMAKVVGERWQVLPVDERDSYESTAANAKEKYMNAMAEYKKTDDYAQYQDYLAEFKARHSNQPHAASGSKRIPRDMKSSETLSGSSDFPKRAKLETETSTETQSSLEDHSLHRRPSASHNLYRSGPGYNSYRHDPYSKSASPATTQYSSMPSPAHHTATDSYSQQGSPTSSNARHTSYDMPPYPSARAPRERTYSSLHDHEPNAPARHPPLMHQASTGSSGSLPPLSKELSSRGSMDSPQSPTGPPLQALMKDGVHPSSRVLPTPVNSSGFTLEHRPLPAPSYGPHDDPRQSSSLAALLRAGELASEEDRLRESAQTIPRSTAPRS